MNLVKCIHYDSGNYLWASGQVKNVSGKKTQSTPVGIVLHSTGEGTVALKRYVQPSKSDPEYANLIKLIGQNKYGNSWNRASVKKGVHYMIGQLADKSIAAAQMLPENYACWGCGAGKKGSYNYYPTQHIQIEMQDGNNDNFDVMYQTAVELCADICTRYGWDATKIVSHKEAHAKGYASNHGDADAWFKKHNTTMNQFRADVEIAMKKPEPEPPTPTQEIKVGDTVNFTGTKCWSNSQKADDAYAVAKPGLAIVTQIYRLNSAKHPYRLKSAGGEGSAKVSGWCNKEDVHAIVPDPDDVPYAPSVGENIKFVGTKQFTNANQAEDKGKAAIPCVAKINRIYRLGKSKHPYNAYGSGVKGWINAEDIRKL